MATQTVTNTQSKTQLNDFFTSTIVGLPQKVVLGQKLKARTLNSDQFVTVDAMQAKAWLSEPAYKYLKLALLKSQRMTGGSFKKHLANQISSSRKSSVLIFLFGFLVCAASCLALAYASSRAWIHFSIFN